MNDSDGEQRLIWTSDTFSYSLSERGRQLVYNFVNRCYYYLILGPDFVDKRTVCYAVIRRLVLLVKKKHKSFFTLFFQCTLIKISVQVLPLDTFKA